jgi:hypothetical protein
MPEENGIVWEIRKFEFLICFVLRASNFGFNRLQSKKGACSHFFPSSSDRLVAASTASISMPRIPPLSKMVKPWMVVPPGEVI